MTADSQGTEVREPKWVSVVGVAWVLDDAPVPSDLALTLLAIARRADDHGRGCRPSAATVARDTGKSVDQVRRDIARLRALNLLVLGDQSLVEHLPAGQRPVVYDLPLSTKGSKPAKESRNKSGGKTATRMGATPGSRATPGMHAGSTPGMDAESTPGMDARQKKPLKNHLEEPSSSSRRRPQVAVAVRSLIEADDDEEAIAIAEEAKRRSKAPVRSLVAYVRGCSPESLAEIRDELRAEAAKRGNPADPLADRQKFMDHIAEQELCEHGWHGGHITWPGDGQWVSCPVRRQQLKEHEEWVKQRAKGGPWMNPPHPDLAYSLDGW